MIKGEKDSVDVGCVFYYKNGIMKKIKIPEFGSLELIYSDGNCQFVKKQETFK